MVDMLSVCEDIVTEGGRMEGRVLGGLEKLGHLVHTRL